MAGTSHAPCGYCRKCIAGRYNLCENFGDEGLHHQYGHNTDGAYADYVVHSVRSVFPVPGRAVATPRRRCSTRRRSRCTRSSAAGSAPGDTVVVVGPGVMGLLVAECARASAPAA